MGKFDITNLIYFAFIIATRTYKSFESTLVQTCIDRLSNESRCRARVSRGDDAPLSTRN